MSQTQKQHTSYLLECLEALPISLRVLQKLEIENLESLANVILVTLKNEAKELDFEDSSGLTTWLSGLIHFQKGALEVPSLVKITPEESSTIKLLFKKVFQILFNRLAQRVDLLKLVFQAIDQWQRIYNETSQTGFQLGMDIRIIVPEPNPFAKENDSHYLMLSELLYSLEQEDIPKINWHHLTADEQFGGYLFFAISQSGLTQIGQINQLVQVSLSRQRMDLPFSGFLLLKEWGKSKLDAYQDEIFNNQSENIYRWIPDPITKRIYEFFRKQWDGLKIQNKHAGNYIQDFLEALLRLSKTSKTRLNHNQLIQLEKSIKHLSHLPSLIKASRAYQRRTLPSFIWHYLENSYQSKDLEPQSTQRLHQFIYDRLPNKIPTGGLTKDAIASISSHRHLRLNSAAGKNDRDELNSQDASSVESTDQIHIAWCDEVAAILNQNIPIDQKIYDIGELKTKFIREDFSLIHLLNDWVIDLLSHGSTIATLTDYVEKFLPTLIAHYDLNEDFSDFDEVERQEEIEELIAEHQQAYPNIDDVKRSIVLFKKAWHALHLYLLKTERIYPDAYTVSQSKKSKVDAEYISEREYRAIQTYLLSQKLSLRLRNQCLLILTLAYRFGLRRSEVIKLAINHISFKDNEPDQISIRWWSERRLKSSSSKRTLPIKGVLTDLEFMWLHLMTLERRTGDWLDEDLFNMDRATLQNHIAQAQSIYIKKKQSKKLNDVNHLPSDTYLFIDNDKSVDARTLEIVNIIHTAMRTVIGNPKLRLHHLRHSCAMNTLMLLLSPKLERSRPLLLEMYYGNQKKTDAYIATQKHRAQLFFHQYIFTDESFESRSLYLRKALLNQEHTSTSEVYTTSRLLGHSSPRTTFASYIHVLPLLTGAFLMERFENYSQKLQEALYPNHSRTLKRNKKAVTQGKLKTLLNRQKLGRPFK